MHPKEKAFWPTAILQRRSAAAVPFPVPASARVKDNHKTVPKAAPKTLKEDDPTLQHPHLEASIWQDAKAPVFIFCSEQASWSGSLSTISKETEGSSDSSSAAAAAAMKLLPAVVVAVLHDLWPDECSSCSLLTEEERKATTTRSSKHRRGTSYHEWYGSDYSPVTTGFEDYFF
jgi:hypothetical protein